MPAKTITLTGIVIVEIRIRWFLEGGVEVPHLFVDYDLRDDAGDRPIRKTTELSGSRISAFLSKIDNVTSAISTKIINEEGLI